MNRTSRRVTRGLCLLLALSVVGSWGLRTRPARGADNPFDAGAEEADKAAREKDPLFKKPAPAPKPKPKPAPPKTPATAPAKDPKPANTRRDYGLYGRFGPKKAEIIDKTILYYLEMYTKQLASGEWVTRAMAVISLAKIDDPRIADKLLSVAQTDRDNTVRVYAWEALHARAASLTDEQRAQWLSTGCLLVQRRALRGVVRAGVIRAIGAAGPTRAHQRAFMTVLASTNGLNSQNDRIALGRMHRDRYAATAPMHRLAITDVYMPLYTKTHKYQYGSEADQLVLKALQETLLAWKSPELVRMLIGQLSNIHTAHRAEQVLSALDATIPSAHLLQYAATFENKTVRGQDWATCTRAGSRAAWTQAQKDWTTWLRKNRLTPATADDLGPYEGKSLLIEPPEKLTDPSADKWRKDLELPRFNLGSFDVNFVLDSTSSMGYTMTWIRADLTRMMQALKLVSRAPRLGVTLYRDYMPGMSRGDYLVTASATPAAAGNVPHDYVVMLAPMTGNADVLSRTVATASARGGGDVPEAVYEALWAAINKNTWSRTGPKLVVLAGDAPPHAKTMDKIKTLVEDAAKKGFKFLCVKIANSIRKPVPVTQQYEGKTCDLDMSFALIAKWGKGKVVAINPAATVSRYKYMALLQSQGLVKPGGVAAPSAGHHQIIAEVLRTELAEYYHDRVDPFVRVLLELAQTPEEERRDLVPPLASTQKSIVPQKTTWIYDYYTIDSRLLASIRTNAKNPRQRYAMKFLEQQGRYTWIHLPTSDIPTITARGVKITTERAREIMTSLQEGKNPFK